MSNRIMKAAVVAAAAVSALAGASSASADWHSNGVTSFSAASPTALTAIVVRTNNPNGLGYNCDQGLLSGSVAATGPASGTWTSALSFTPSFERCSIAGVPMIITGASGTFDASSYAAGVTSGTYRASWTANWSGICTFEVSIVAPATSNGTALTVSTTGQSGTISWPHSTGCTNTTGITGPASASATLTGSTASTDVAFSYSGTAPILTN
jgi:hypothetical protein